MKKDRKCKGKAKVVGDDKEEMDSSSSLSDIDEWYLSSSDEVSFQKHPLFHIVTFQPKFLQQERTDKCQKGTGDDEGEEDKLASDDGKKVSGFPQSP